jgi:tetratricopeptide (TPR) repeat protein
MPSDPTSASASSRALPACSTAVDCGILPGMLIARLVAALGLAAAQPVMALDLGPLWDFANPALSEQRFRQALATAQGDDALVLRTQIARSLGLRRDFEGARAELRPLEPALASAGAEARVRHALEWGRTWASAAHRPEEVSEAAKVEARQAWQRALTLARESGLDALAIDAIHMFAFVDTSAEDQRRHAEDALAVALASSQSAARRWEPSIRHNLGMALHGLGRYPEALAQFEQALALREAQSSAAQQRIARWMVAWALRAMQRLDEALAIQLRLERENDAAGEPDPYVFEELQALYTAKGDVALAERYAERRKAIRPTGSTGG